MNVSLEDGSGNKIKDRPVQLKCLLRYAESGMLRAGARPVDSSPIYQSPAFEIIEQCDPQLAADEHVIAGKQLLADVHAAGSWHAYARLTRKDAYKVIQRLRSLEARARATTSDVFLRSAFRLPDEMLLKVLGFWRATTSTGVPL